MGEKVSHIKTKRKRWYDDKNYTDDSRPPPNAPQWAISQSYMSDDEPGESSKAQEGNNS
jgi:hypothetical protein